MIFDNSNIEMSYIILFCLCKPKHRLSSINNESISQKQVKVMSNMKTNEKSSKRMATLCSSNYAKQTTLIICVGEFIIEKCTEVAKPEKGLGHSEGSKRFALFSEKNALLE